MSSNNKTSTQNTHPHIRDVYAPLQDTITSVIRRFGDFSVGAIDGDTVTMFIDLANMIVEEVNSHPYWDYEPLDYFTHPSESRPISNLILQNGLLFQYAIQQASPKIELYSKIYYQSMNTLLWRKLNGGNGAQRFYARVVDGGSNRKDSPATSPITGQRINTDE